MDEELKGELILAGIFSLVSILFFLVCVLGLNFLSSFTPYDTEVKENCNVLNINIIQGYPLFGEPDKIIICDWKEVNKDTFINSLKIDTPSSIDIDKGWGYNYYSESQSARLFYNDFMRR